MLTLFPQETAFPEGFHYEPDFITPEEEERLLAAIRGLKLKTFVFQGYEAKRKVASFGFDWSFEHRRLSKGKDIPDAFRFLVDKTAEHLEQPGFAELLVTEYPAGSVINWHRDAPPFGLIAGISLLSDCTFRLRPYDPPRRGRGELVTLKVDRRSLYTINGPAREAWQHSTAPVETTRYSITLRTLKHPL